MFAAEFTIILFFPFGIAWLTIATAYYVKLGQFNYRTPKWEEAWPEIAGYYNYLQVVEADKRTALLDQDRAGFTISEHDPYLTAGQFQKQWSVFFAAGHEIGASSKDYQTYRP